MGISDDEPAAPQRSRILRALPGMAVVSGVALVAAIAIVRDFHQERAQAAARMESIAELRATQVQAWFDRHMGFAHFLDDSAYLATLYTQWQEHGDAEAGRQLLARAIDSRRADDADSALLTDAAGRVLAREHPANRPAAPELMATVARAVAEGRATNSTIYRRPGTELPQRLDIVVPLLKTGPQARGALVLRIDPRRSLFPLLANWPVPSATGEAVLWDRVGDRLVNISPLHHDADSLGTVDEPLAASRLPPARLARGELPQGTAVAVSDHRGVAVLWAGRAVPGTHWWLVAKMDMDEVDAPAWQRARVTLLAAALALLGAALGSRVLAQRRLVRRVERERREQRDRLHALALLEAIARSASEVICAKDPAGRYVFCNPAGAELLGRSVDEVLGRTDAELLPPDVAARVAEADRRALRGELAASHEEVLMTAHGTVHLLSTRGPLVDAEGNPFGLLVVSRDMTAMREAQRALRDSEEHFRTVVSVLNEGIIVSDAAGRVVSSNPAAARLLGAPVREGHDSATVVPGWQVRFADGRPMTAQERPTARVLAGEGAVHGVLTHATGPAGEHFVFEVGAVPLVGADGVRNGVVTTFFDVTAQHRMEKDLRRHRDELEADVAQRTAELVRANEALARSRDEAETANRAKSAFLANISHEIRTPLNAMLGVAYLLARDPRDALQRERLTKIGEAGQHLLQIINDVLDLSKIEAGKLTLEETDFSLDALLATACDMVGERAQAKGLALVVDTEHLPRRLKGDPTRLSQMILNLLSNAVKFTEHGWIRLKGELLDDADGRVHIRFEVHDTGAGIAPERQAELFNAFEQGDNTTTRRFGGTGLGLSLTRNLAAAMGGEVGVDSTPGVGSTFWFTVRMRPAEGVDAGVDEPAKASALHAVMVRVPDQDGAPVRDASEAMVRAAHAGRRVLLAEDNLINRLIARELLAHAALDVQEAENGAIALELATTQHWDLILMDMQMPVMDGLDAARAIRARGHLSVPIIAMTANAFVEDRAACLAAGMNDHVAKPVDPAALYEILMRWLPSRAPASP